MISPSVKHADVNVVRVDRRSQEIACGEARRQVLREPVGNRSTPPGPLHQRDAKAMARSASAQKRKC
jgi:hypothetical protein